MTTTPNLSLSLLAAEQAQKHVTMNEALTQLDALVHLTVISAVVTAPPGSPAEGDRYIVPAGATGAWVGMATLVASFTSGVWLFYVPEAGWRAWNIATSALLVFTAGAWSTFGGGSVNLTTQATGTLQAAQMPSFTGDVTNAGLAMTIPAGTITLTKQANMATASVVYRKTAGAGAPEVQTLATLKTDLGLTNTNSGDQTITLTGPVTGSGTGSFATTIIAGAITLAMMANLAANSFIGNITGAPAVPIAMTAAQAKTLLAITTADIPDAVPNTGSKTIAGSTTFTGNVIASDANFLLQDDADATKQFKIQLANITSGTIRTVAMPDISGGAWVLDTGTQSIGGAKTFTGSLIATVANVTLQDNNLTVQDNLDPTKTFQFQAAGITTATNRIFTVPDASGTIMLTNTVTAAAQEPAHTGDVTNTAGSLNLTIIASVGLTGNPTAPTQVAGNNSTRLANTAFVTSQIGRNIAIANGEYLF